MPSGSGDRRPSAPWQAFSGNVRCSSVSVIIPAIPLMEDVELAIRLRCLGRRIYLNGNVLVSTRRWQEKGFANACLISRLFFHYLFMRLSGNPEPELLYLAYYGHRVQ